VVSFEQCSHEWSGTKESMHVMTREFHESFPDGLETLSRHTMASAAES
jgi:hypothetical protein